VPFLLYTWSARLLFGLLLVAVSDVGSSHANMIGPPPFDLEHPLNLAALFLTFGATTIIEFYVIYRMLGRPKKAKKGLLLCALLINALTNPLTQLLVWLLQAWFMIELLVVLVEMGFLVWIFKRMYHFGKLEQPVTFVRTVVIALVANGASFGLGLVGLFVLSIMLPSRPMLPLWRLIF
jgi:hypothetical protein